MTETADPEVCQSPVVPGTSIMSLSTSQFYFGYERKMLRSTLLIVTKDISYVKKIFAVEIRWLKIMF
jgi:hypothetical protein